MWDPFCDNGKNKEYDTKARLEKNCLISVKLDFSAIKRVDPNFTQDNFVRFLEKEMIPIILEAGAMNNVEVVEDWAMDAASQRFLMRHNAAAKSE